MLHKGEVNVYMWVILELNPGILGRICASDSLQQYVSVPLHKLADTCCSEMSQDC